MEQHFSPLLRHPLRQVTKVFTDHQTERLIELIKENEHKLFPNSFNKPKRCTARKTWATICHVFNAEFPMDPKTPEQIRIKWKNMLQKARGSGQAHLLFGSNHTNQNYLNSDEFVPSSTDTFSDFNTSTSSSLANVLGAFPEMDESRDESWKTERESSILSVSTESNGDPAPNQPTKLDDYQFLSAETSNARPEPANVQISVTEGPPIVLSDNNDNGSKRRSTNEDHLWSVLTKRRRTVVDEMDDMKRDLLAVEVQNAKKWGLVLDEALGFLKRLNQPNGIGDKLNGLLNGH